MKTCKTCGAVHGEYVDGRVPNIQFSLAAGEWLCGQCDDNLTGSLITRDPEWAHWEQFENRLSRSPVPVEIIYHTPSSLKQIQARQHGVRLVLQEMESPNLTTVDGPDIDSLTVLLGVPSRYRQD